MNRVLCRLCYSLLLLFLCFFYVVLFLLFCNCACSSFLSCFCFCSSFLCCSCFLPLFHPLRLVPNTRGMGGDGGSNRGSEREADTQGGKADPKGRYKCASQKEDTTPTATRLYRLWTKRKVAKTIDFIRNMWRACTKL